MTKGQKSILFLRALVLELGANQPGRADDLRIAAEMIERLETERDDLVSILSGIGKQAAAVAKSYTTT